MPQDLRKILALQPGASPAEYELLIYGYIGESFWDESTSGRDVVAQIDALPPSVTVINIHVDSPGGSVLDGLSIYNALKRSSARRVVHIEGVAASIASFITTAGDEVRIPATAVVMVHAPSGPDWGTAKAKRKAADMLDTFAGTMAPGYAAKTGLSVDEVMAQLLDGEDHFFTGSEAVDAGLADVLETFTVEPAESLADVNASFAQFIEQATAERRIQAMAVAARLPIAATQATSVADNTTAPDAHTGVDPMPNQNTQTHAVDHPAVDAAAITTQLTNDLRNRNADIQAMIQPHIARDGMQAILVQALADPSLTVEAVRKQVLDNIGASTSSAASMSVEHGADESDKFRAAAENAILARSGQVKADGQNPLRGYRMLEIARASLERTGHSRRGMDPMEVVAAAFTTTSDFPALLTSTARASLLRGYDESPETFDQWTRAGTLTDFREASKVGLGIFSDLEKIPENGEYKYGSFGTTGQKIVLATYGKMFAISRQAIINDDLGAFTAVPQKMGRAAKRTIGNLVYAVLNNNPNLQDGNALFSAAHKNLIAPGTGITTASVSAMRKLLGGQTVDKQPVNIPLKYLLVPLNLEDDAELVRDNQFAVNADGTVSSNANTQRGKFEVVSDARLSGNAWYGAADPNLFDTVEVDYLDGVQQPFLDQKDGWNVDGTEFKVRIDAGVAPLDFRGLAKNPGLA